MLHLDHLTITAGGLDEGTAFVEDCLGVPLDAGGRHAAMGTHNRLLGLGPGCYLEVITVDPAAPPPGRPRWFDLDSFRGPPRMTHWAARCDDLPRALARAPAGAGTPVALERGELRWQMAVPDDGRLPFGGAFPALIAWESDAHPSRMLPERRCRLRKLELFHPEAAELAQSLAGLLVDERVTVSLADAPRLRALIDTPAGERVLG